MIHKDFWGRYTSSSSGTEAKVYAKSVELQYTDTGRTVHYTATKFKNRSLITCEACIVPHNYFQDHSKKKSTSPNLSEGGCGQWLGDAGAAIRRHTR